MGTITVLGQLTVFLISVIFGAAYCLLYDILRILRTTVIKSKISVFISDILYWVVITFISLSFSLLFSKGEIRGYWLLGILLGFIISRLTVSKFLIFISEYIILFLRLVKRYIYRGFIFVMEKLNSFLMKIPNMFKKIFKRKKKHLERERDVSV